MPARPIPDQLLWLRAPSGAAYDARVVSASAEVIVLERPEEHPGLEDTRRFEAIWTDEEGMLSLEVDINDDGAQWMASPVSAIGPAQRRAHPRVALATPMMLVWDSVAHRGLLLDMSEAALRVLLPVEGTPGVTDQTLVHADVHLDGEGFVLPGHVLRSKQTAEGLEVVVIFDDVAGLTVNRLRRAIFFEQLRLDASS
jgi:hypothetical protein